MSANKIRHQRASLSIPDLDGPPSVSSTSTRPQQTHLYSKIVAPAHGKLVAESNAPDEFFVFAVGSPELCKAWIVPAHLADMRLPAHRRGGCGTL